jgi:hypothetical protein
MILLPSPKPIANDSMPITVVRLVFRIGRRRTRPAPTGCISGARCTSIESLRRISEFERPQQHARTGAIADAKLVEDG